LLIIDICTSSDTEHALFAASRVHYWFMQGNIKAIFLIVKKALMTLFGNFTQNTLLPASNSLACPGMLKMSFEFYGRTCRLTNPRQAGFTYKAYGKTTIRI